ETYNTQLEVRKTIAASAEQLFDAWLNPQSVKKWMCPGSDVSVPNPKIDARVGGKFDFTMDVGGNLKTHKGEYKIIERLKKLKLTWVSPATNNAASVVTILFQARGDKTTEVILQHEFLPDDQVQGHTKGWSRILDCLDQAYAKQASKVAAHL